MDDYEEICQEIIEILEDRGYDPEDIASISLTIYDRTGVNLEDEFDPFEEMSRTEH